MNKNQNPWDQPQWHSLQREAQLVKQLIGSGVTALGRANYADKTGEYYTAFFGLSIGIERLAKLILVTDYAIENTGNMPDEKFVRKHGHKLIKLLAMVDKLSIEHNIRLQFARPSTSVSGAIVNCLDAFADASQGRYANFAALGNPNLREEEPIKKWWGEVAALILTQHYFGKRAQLRIEENADIVHNLTSPISVVLYFDEQGSTLQDIRSASIRTGQTEIVQRFGRFYALTIVRWMANVFSELSRSACYNHQMDNFFGLWEHFYTYLVDDSFLKTRKIWPLT